MKLLAILSALHLMPVVPHAWATQQSIGFSTPSVPESTDLQARRCAAELLARYVKLRDGKFLSQVKFATMDGWVEHDGLRLTQVMPQTVSHADQANGIQAIYLVILKSQTHRTYDPKTARWSESLNGLYLLFPGVIRVTQRQDGNHVAESSMLSRFLEFTARGNPELIPYVREREISKPVSVLQNPLARNDSAPKGGKEPVPHNPMQAASQEIVNKAVGLAAFMVVLVVIAGVVTALFGSKRIRRRANPTVQHPLPPPLPTEASPSPDHSLIVGQTHLLTQAERSFHAVLESIVRPTCSISTKVRLADLFQVKAGRGQQAAFNRISRKHVDFVLTDPSTSRIFCAIELDDSSHSQPDRITRDQFVDELFNANRMSLVRIPFEWKYNPAAIREKMVQSGVPLPPSS